MPDEKAPSSGAFLPESLMYFRSGQTTHYCSGVDMPRMQFGLLPRGLPHFGQLDKVFTNRSTYGIWQWLTRNWVSLTMLGGALTTR